MAQRWWLLCCALVGVVALNGVVDAKAMPARGAVCARGGATATDGVSGRGLVCVQTRARGLRWQFQPTMVTTPTTSPTTTVPGVVAPVVVSASADDDVQVTVAEMRPNTGVYSLQWVPYGQTFNNYEMARATSPSMSVPAGWFACNRTYTFRVFVMRADWQLADGHQTQNVTHHSTPFDVVMPACPTPTSPLTCATGGVCIVGDTGPGGGIVFYVASTNFTSTGSDCGTTCKNLEAAPTGWGNGITVAAGETTGTSTVDPQLAWCSDISTLRNATTKTAIGDGRLNTTNPNTGAGACTTGAIYHAELYAGNGKTDWHLPSKDELNELCKYAKNQPPGTIATVCAGTGVLRSGFSSVDYWSSSESNATSVWGQAFYTVFGSNQYLGTKNINNVAVRPVRAFG
jgi:Protein of unknown function (DUF1566)